MRPPRRPRLTELQYFNYNHDTQKWTCNICTSQCHSMTTRAAVKHERTAEHKENVFSHIECDPADDVDDWVNLAAPHIDLLRLYIPFWRRTIEAAKYGKTLRFEDFLNGLSKKRQPPSKVDPDLEGPGWPTVSTNPPDVEQRSRARCSGCASESDREGFDFVERIARMNSADAERRKRLHSFYNIPTKEKLQRINELIDALRNMGQKAS